MCFTARDQPPPSDVIDTPPPRHRSITFSDAAMLTTERQSLGTVVLQSKQKTPSTQQHNLKKANTTTGTSDSKPKTSFKPMRIDIKGCQQLEPVFEDQNSLMPRKPGIRHPHSPFPTKEQLAAVRSVVSTPEGTEFEYAQKACCDDGGGSDTASYFSARSQPYGKEKVIPVCDALDSKTTEKTASQDCKSDH